MASIATDALNVESSVQQRTLKVDQSQSKKFAICGAVAVISVVSAMVGYSAAVLSAGPTHPIAKAFHMTVPVSPSQQAASRIPSAYPRIAGRSSIKMQSAVVADVMEKIKGMTMMEGAELVKEIETFFDVDASAGGGAVMMAPGAAVAGGGADAPAAEEQTEFDVILESFPADKKIPVLKEVRTITGLGLMEAKKFVESAPKPLKEGIGKTEAVEMKKTLEEAGAVVVLK